MTRGALILNSVIAGLGILGSTAVAVVFGYKWLASDEANRSYSCGSGSRSGTCFEGEITNMVLTFVFGGLAIAGILLTISAVRHHGRKRHTKPIEYTVMTVGPRAPAEFQLRQLEALRAAGAISDADFHRRRRQVIDDI